MITRLLSWLELWGNVISAEVSIRLLLWAEVILVRIKYLGSMVVTGLVRMWFLDIFLHWLMILMVLDDVGLVISVMFFCMIITLFIV